MNNDKRQIIVTEKPKKKNKAAIAIIVLVALMAVGGIYYATSYKLPEKVKTGEKMGEPTIMPVLQTAVDTFLLAEMEMFDMLQGQAIVMEVQTGEILAMVGLEQKNDGTYQPCRNFAYQQEQGPLMQTVSLLSVLESGKVMMNDVVHTGMGVWSVADGLEMKDHNWHRGGYGSMTLDRALEVSSNIGIGMAVDKAFGNNHQAYFDQLDKMSFGQPDYIEGIEGLRPSIYCSPKDPEWENWKLSWSAIGYERKMTPIQMLTFYNAIANNGKMVKPTLKTGDVEIIKDQIASEKMIKLMQETLEHVVSRGLGKKAGTVLLKVAGKTGTTHVGKYEYGHGTYADEYQVAFCGYFPADAPKYSIIVSMNKLGLPASGGAMAVVVFHNIVEWMVVHDGINARHGENWT